MTQNFVIALQNVANNAPVALIQGHSIPEYNQRATWIKLIQGRMLTESCILGAATHISPANIKILNTL